MRVFGMDRLRKRVQGQDDLIDALSTRLGRVESQQGYRICHCGYHIASSFFGRRADDKKKKKGKK